MGEDGLGSWVGDLRPRFAGVGSIAVLRGTGLGDLVQALPAVAALRAAYPGATVTLLGTPVHVNLLSDRPSPFTTLEVLPRRPGVRDGGPEDPAATAAFVQRMQGRELDLAVQLHGGGRNSNGFLLALGARHTVGSRTEDAPELERSRPYVYYQHEVARALEVVALAGAVPVGLEPQLPLLPEEQARRRGRRPDRPTVVLHPGATDPRRRWPAAAFAAVASALVADGVRVVLAGDGEDVPAADAIRRQVVDPERLVSSRAGEQSLPELVQTLLDSDVVLANDSGPRHVAAALDVRTVGVYWVGNVVNAGPLGRGRHRIQIGFTAACPVCGVDITQVGWTAERCEHDGSIVADVPPERVLADVRSLLADVAHERRHRVAAAGSGGPDGQVG